MTDTKNADTQSTNGQSTDGNDGGIRRLASQLPLDRLKNEAKGYGLALAERGVAKVGEKVQGMTGKLTDVAEGKPLGKSKNGSGDDDSGSGDSSGGSLLGTAVKDGIGSAAKTGVGSLVSGAVDKVKGVFGMGSASGKSPASKTTYVFRNVDVPVDREKVYDQWMEFEDTTGKVRPQVFRPGRDWDSEAVEQEPGQLISWKSDVNKTPSEGAATFHDLTSDNDEDSPELTRIEMVLEYHHRGPFYRIGNLWRKRRAKNELKRFAQHVTKEEYLHKSGEEEDADTEDGQNSPDTANDSADSQDGAPEDEMSQDDQPQDDSADDETSEDTASEDDGSTDSETQQTPRPSKKSTARTK